MQILRYDWLSNHTLTAVGVQWAVAVYKMVTFSHSLNNNSVHTQLPKAKMMGLFNLLIN